jgi:sugar fermentation stimulation protein A
VPVQLGPGLIEGRFLVRLNRFAAAVEVAGQEVMVHVANSGRMRELLVRGNRVLVKPVLGDRRKTRFDLALVDLGFTLASADARLPNVLMAEALEGGGLPQFRDYPRLHREVPFAESRLDLMLEGPGGRCYVETKSVTLVVDGVGLFPDAPTLRGVKHLGSLVKAVAAGHRGVVVFVVQREDARAVAPHDVADPQFGAALRQAVAAGVEAFAYRCRVTPQEITLSDRLPVNL